MSARRGAKWRLQAPPTLRRGALFLINIGIPITAGVVMRQVQPTLIAAVAGMVLSFADNDGPLSGRLRLLLFDVAAISMAGLISHVSAGTPPLHWVLLAAVTFATGLAAGGGREPVIIGRHSAIAFIVAAAYPAFAISALIYLGGAVLVNVASRSVDHLLFGPLPLLPQVPMQKPASYGGWFRFALAFATTAVAGMWIGDRLGEQHGYWVVITTLMVMQPDAIASSMRIIQRIGGTVAGVAVAWGIALAVHSQIAIYAAIMVVAPLIPHHLTQRYWLHTGLIALLVLLAFDLAQFNSQGMGRLPLERIQDIFIGCALALLGTMAAFPRTMLSR